MTSCFPSLIVVSVKGVALKWFYSYLTDRSQTFSVGDSKSDCHRVSCSVPQGSVEFVAYTEDVADLFDRHEVNHYLYADDQQIYLHTEPGLTSTRLSLAACFSDLSAWWSSQLLQLNVAKTEIIWFGSWSMLHHLTSDNHSLSIGSVVVKSVDVDSDLGVLLEPELTMKQHICHVVSTVSVSAFVGWDNSIATSHKTPWNNSSAL